MTKLWTLQGDHSLLVSEVLDPESTVVGLRLPEATINNVINQYEDLLGDGETLYEGTKEKLVTAAVAAGTLGFITYYSKKLCEAKTNIIIGQMEDIRRSTVTRWSSLQGFRDRARELSAVQCIH